jgi:protein NUD1
LLLLEPRQADIVIESKRPEAQARPSTPGQHSPLRMVSIMNRFGENDLDDHTFPEEFSSMLDDDDCPVDAADDLPSRSPSPDVIPPGSQRPFRFRAESPMAMNDTFKHKRKGSRVSSKGFLSVAKRNSTKRGRPEELQAQSGNQAKEDISIQDGKRPPPSPYKNSTPKRRRTLMTGDIEQEAVEEEADLDTERAQAVVDSSIRIQSIVKGKRKDSRVGSLMTRADPNILSKRHILRPRNPTPSQRRYELLPTVAIQQASDDVPSSPPREKSVGTHLDVSQSPLASSELLQENAIASELAAFSQRISTRMEDGSRKTSYTTQDYLDEALKIMNFIRNKGRPASELSNVMESLLEDAEELESEEQALDDLSDLQEEDFIISRSPSHEYGKGGWRKRNEIQRSPSIIKHLEKYKESEEDDYVRNSVASRFDSRIRHASERIEAIESDPPGLRVMEQSPHLKAEEELNQNDEVLVDSQRSSGSDRSHQTQGSSESSLGRTSTSRKSETTVQTIRPDVVAPLIPKSVGLLVFDKDMNAWVKKPKDITTSSPNHSNSIHTSEDDPFSDIPDLTIDAEEEARRLLRAQISGQEVDASTMLRRHMEEGLTSSKENLHPDDAQVKESSNVSFSSVDLAQQSPKRGFLNAQNYSSQRRISNLGECDGDIEESVMEQVEPSQFAASSPPSALQRDPEDQTAESIYQDDDSLLSVDPSQQSVDAGTVQLIRQAARTDINSTITTFGNQKGLHEPQIDREDEVQVPNSAGFDMRERNFAHPSSFRLGETLTSDCKKSTNPSIVHTHNIRDPLQRTVQFSSAVAEYSASDINHSSLTSPKSHSAFYNHSSVALISSPLSKQRSKQPLITLAPPPEDSINLLPTTLAPASSPAGHYSTFLLSELSEFTVDQVDEREVPTRAIVKRHSGRTVYENRFAWGDHLLIMAMQYRYGAELYWDSLEEVDLQGQNITSLNALDDACPNITRLNVDNNQLSSIQGCPPTVNTLLIADNRLSNITNFNMMENLRIIDVSGNHLTSLAPFNGLIHLQVLKADKNKIKEIKGLYNPSMQLKELSMRQNRFSGKLVLKPDTPEHLALTHLEQLDLSDNEITSISGLEELVKLEVLKLSGNEIKQFVLEYDPAVDPALTVLNVSKNELTSFVIKGRTGNLTDINISVNRLSAKSIELQYATYVQCLNVRKQTGSMDGFKPFTDKYSRVAVLLMGSNRVSQFELHEPLKSVEALDIANCGLSKFPDDLQEIFPRLQTLNANFNNIKSPEPIAGYETLETLLLAGNNIVRLRAPCNVVRTCPSLRAVDFRGNPITAGFYQEDKAVFARVTDATNTTTTMANKGTKMIPRALTITTLSDVQHAREPHDEHVVPSGPAADVARELIAAERHLPIVSSDGYGLPQALNRRGDDAHMAGLEREEKAVMVRRRCWDLLLPTQLVLADGLWRSEHFVRRVRSDEYFEKLVRVGVVKRTIGRGDDYEVVAGGMQD